MRLHQFRLTGVLAAALTLSSCSAGPRFYVNIPEPGTGTKQSDYWAYYKDWDINQINLEKKIELPRTPLDATKPDFDRVTGSYLLLKDHLPATEEESFQKFLKAYDELRQDALGGGNRSLIFWRLESVGKGIRARFHPDKVHPPEPPPGEEPGSTTPKS